jgi:DNA repair photolyase
MYKRIQCKTALNKLSSRYLPYHWDLNVYRGCSHRCRYCYALYSHNYLNDGDFFGDIFIKENILEALEAQLKKKSWKQEVVNLGGVTDSYQAIEKEEALLPEILKLFIKYKTPISISTKSDLILRDKDLFIELGELAGASIGISVTTFDEDLRKKIEPCSSSTRDRFNILDAFKGTSVRTGVLFMPILPFLTDSKENIEQVFRACHEAEANFVYAGLLNLRGPTRGYFLNFIREVFPEYYEQYIHYYTGKSDKKSYREKVYAIIAQYKKQYPIIAKPYLKKNKVEQLTLF